MDKMRNKLKIKGNVVGLLMALLLFGSIGIIGDRFGAFDDVSDLVSGINIDPKKIVGLLIMIAFVSTLTNLVQLVIKIFRKNNARALTLSTVISSMIKYLSVIIMVCWGLTIIGVNVTTVFASVGILALIIGFGAESLVADVVTGTFILFENQFNVGDVIEVNGFRGNVEAMGIRTVSIKDAGGNVKIINNSDLKNVINRSDNISVCVSDIGIAYELDLREVEAKLPAILEKIKADHKDIFIGKIQYLGVEELADSAVILKFIAEVREQDIFAGKRILNRDLKCAFDDENICIAFPQMDVHVK